MLCSFLDSFIYFFYDRCCIDLSFMLDAALIFLWLYFCLPIWLDRLQSSLLEFNYWFFLVCTKVDNLSTLVLFELYQTFLSCFICCFVVNHPDFQFFIIFYVLFVSIFRFIFHVVIYFYVLYGLHYDDIDDMSCYIVSLITSVKYLCWF